MDNKKLEQIKEKLLYKRVIEWNREKDYIILEDGIKVDVYCSDYDCCAHAYGEFKNVELDAVITDVVYDIEMESEYDGDTYVSQAVLKLFHNQNEIAQNMVYANAGNGGYYYSVASLRIGDFETEILTS